jgi:hypothetical protein
MEKPIENKLEIIKDKKIINADTKEEMKLGDLWTTLKSDQVIFIIFFRNFG